MPLKAKLTPQPQESGGNQEALLQAARRARDGTRLWPTGGRAASACCTTKSLHPPRYTCDSRRGINPFRARGNSSGDGFVQQSHFELTFQNEWQYHKNDLIGQRHFQQDILSNKGSDQTHNPLVDSSSLSGPTKFL